jgi:glycosyltransferase involved in cell wall biosynthesis
MMKIVIINQHPHDKLGGSEIQCDIIATYLTRFGHQVTYLAVKAIATAYETPYTVIPLPDFKSWQIYQSLKKIRPDVVYWRHNKKGLLVSAAVSKLLGSRFICSISSLYDTKPLVYSGQTIFTGTSNRKADLHYWRSVLSDLIHLRPLRSIFNYLAILFFADGVVTLNQDYLSKIPHKNKIIIHNSMPTLTTDFEWPRPYIVWVANLKRIKNPDKFFELAKALTGTGVDFLMVGKLLDQSYSYLATANNECTSFHYLGPQSPLVVNGILANSLFLVHTCNPEGFGNIFIQAWLQAKPTISLYFDPEGIIEGERIGYLSRTFSQLVEQTRFLIENESKRTAMGQRAQQFATKQFDAEVNVRRLENFLIDVISVKEEKR